MCMEYNIRFNNNNNNKLPESVIDCQMSPIIIAEHASCTQIWGLHEPCYFLSLNSLVF